MNKFDDLIKRKAMAESCDIPSGVRNEIEKTLSELPKKKGTSGLRIASRIASLAACAALVLFVIMPNCSNAYAHALEQIPVLGDIVRVVTIRNYFYSDSHHEMDITVPRIEGDGSEATDYINKDVDELTGILVERFRSEIEEVGGEGHSSLYVDYDVVTNSPSWFTLRVRIFEAAGSSNTYYKYYHIDKEHGRIAKLCDLSDDDAFYTVIEEDIKRQMKERMAEDPDAIYWVDDTEFGWSFTTLSRDHNFYWNENGDIVIAFDKYEVSPGYMGTPEFTIDRAVFADMLK